MDNYKIHLISSKVTQYNIVFMHLPDYWKSTYRQRIVCTYKNRSSPFPSFNYLLTIIQVALLNGEGKIKIFMKIAAGSTEHQYSVLKNINGLHRLSSIRALYAIKVETNATWNDLHIAKKQPCSFKNQPSPQISQNLSKTSQISIFFVFISFSNRCGTQRFWRIRAKWNPGVIQQPLLFQPLISLNSELQCQHNLCHE